MFRRDEIQRQTNILFESKNKSFYFWFKKGNLFDDIDELKHQKKVVASLRVDLKTNKNKMFPIQNLDQDIKIKHGSFKLEIKE